MPRRTWLTLAAVASVAGLLVAGAVLTRGAEDRGGELLSDQGSAITTRTGSASATGAPEPDGSSTATGYIGDAVPSTGATRTAPGSDDATADDGARLTTVTVVPTRTLAAINSDAGEDGDRFTVTFRPYGWGPMRAGGRGLVLRIDSARRAPGNVSDLAFEAGRNMLVTVPAVVAARIDQGGQYSGLLVLHRSSGALALYLEEASAVRE